MTYTLRFWILTFLITSLPAAAHSQGFLQDENHITHGPILGRVSAHGIGIWARTRYESAFTVRYGTKPDRLDVTSEPAQTTVSHDNTGWVHITGLKADTKYWYELRLNDRISGRTGSFRTLPDSEELKDPKYNPDGLFNFSFEFACGNNQNTTASSGPALPAFQTMLRKGVPDEVHFSLLDGDWLLLPACMEDTPIPTVAKRIQELDRPERNGWDIDRVKAGP